MSPQHGRSSQVKSAEIPGRSMLLFDLKFEHADRQRLAGAGRRTDAPASPTYSLPCWAVSRAIRPPWHKEWLSEYSIERRAGVSSRLIGSSAPGDVRDGAVVLVGATRIVGAPFHLHRAAGRRRRRDARLLDQLDWFAADACTGDAGAGASARRPGSAVRPRGMADPGDRAHR